MSVPSPPTAVTRATEETLAIGRGMTATLREFGIDLESVVAEAGDVVSLRCEMESRREAFFSFKALARAAEQTNCPHLGLLIAERMDVIAHLGVLGRILMSSATVADALNEICRYPTLRRAGSIWKLTASGDQTFLSYSLTPLVQESANSAVITPLVMGIQMVMGIQWRLLRHVSRNQCTPEAVYLAFRKPAETRHYQRFFHCQLVFGADFNGFAFRTADLRMPVPSADRDLNRILHSYVNLTDSGGPDNLPDQTRRLIENNLRMGACSVDAVLTHLPYSRTTFQRRLREQGHSYRSLLDDVRGEKAVHFLRNTDISLSRLSALLCYENQSAFTRAFSRKFGQSPSAWRRGSRRSEK